MMNESGLKVLTVNDVFKSVNSKKYHVSQTILIACRYTVTTSTMCDTTPFHEFSASISNVFFKQSYVYVFYMLFYLVQRVFM